MITLSLDRTVLGDPAALHALLARALSFPAWYGGTLDALYDCLTDVTEDVTLTLDGTASEPYGQKVCKVLRAAAAKNPHIQLQLLER